MHRNMADKIKSFVCLTCFYVLVLYFVSGYVLAVYRIEGQSMNPMLMHGDRVLSDRLVFNLSEIRRYDIVVLHSPSEPRKYLIKRIIGLPGETISIDQGTVFINGRAIDENYIPVDLRSSETLKSLLIPHGHYFVLGDNRLVSNDSRLWATQSNLWPFVGERYILGKIRFCVWPVSRIRWISSETDHSSTPPA